VIQRLIGRTRRRIRLQWAIEGATTATILAAATALVSIFAVRMEMVAPSTGIGMLIAAGAIIIAGAVISAARHLDDERVARRIDRASNLADRLSTAIAFRRDAGAHDAETAELMQAAIKDGVRAAARADTRAAAPFAMPADYRVAFLFLVLAAVTGGLSLPQHHARPHVYRAIPDHARPPPATARARSATCRPMLRCSSARSRSRDRSPCSIGLRPRSGSSCRTMRRSAISSCSCSSRPIGSAWST
jgi:hypothetical protein